MKKIFGLMGLAMLAGPAGAADYAAWSAKNPDGTWTRAAEAAVRKSSLQHRVPSDINLYCAHYQSGNDTDRIRFWSALLSAMARPESGFDPSVQFVEPRITDAQGKHVVSRGLLQLSIESANQPRYHCRIKRAKDLHVPAKNLVCAAKILDHWVAQDGSIGVRDGENLGGTRYWSSLRRDRDVAQIRDFTQQLDFCSAPETTAQRR